MSASQEMRASLFTPILIGGSIILLINFALRASFGVFQIPIATEFDWPRAEFSMAIAIQNLAWGIGQPIFGALGERWGDRWSIIIGAFLYSAGLILTAYATTPETMQMLEVMVGFGIAGTGFGVILAVVGRAAVMELGYTGDYYRGFVRTALVPMLVILALCTAVMIYSRELGALIGG